MSDQPQDRPPQAPPTAGPAGGGQPGFGPSTPDPYAGSPGSPGSPMPDYDLDAAAAGPRDHSGVLVAFVLGIFSVVGFSVVGPVAWVIASKALKEIDRPGGPLYTNRGLAVAAKVLGIIGTVLLVLTIIGLIVFAAVAVTAVQRQNA